jgi:hypothetical protein
MRDLKFKTTGMTVPEKVLVELDAAAMLQEMRAAWLATLELRAENTIEDDPTDGWPVWAHTSPGNQYTENRKYVYPVQDRRGVLRDGQYPHKWATPDEIQIENAFTLLIDVAHIGFVPKR